MTFSPPHYNATIQNKVSNNDDHVTAHITVHPLEMWQILHRMSAAPDPALCSESEPSETDNVEMTLLCPITIMKILSHSIQRHSI